MSPLKAEILALIRQEGPISVARYMELALGHPRYGYYMTRDPFGAAGDFTTAPEISQMFGELIGLWCAQVWSDIGAPERVILAEAGPGRGTLMADALRAAKALPAFRRAIEVHLIETSPVLRAAQQRMLASAGMQPVWHDRIDSLPKNAPLLLIANEFLDALPIQQFAWRSGGWFERLVGQHDGRLTLGLAPQPTMDGWAAGFPTPAFAALPGGAVIEVSFAAIKFIRALAGRIRRQGGAALIVDYGYEDLVFHESLQAVKGHRSVDPLEEPGEADLTAHVNFRLIGAAAHVAPKRNDPRILRQVAQAHGPVAQGDFLRALGIEQRAKRLMAGASPSAVKAIAAALERLIEMRPGGMGALFKVLALTPLGTAKPPGFQTVGVRPARKGQANDVTPDS
jgi:NADH dehydrogenase [ubiquinone] 1 alpha subcomplex assembly factor 7